VDIADLVLAAGMRFALVSVALALGVALPHPHAAACGFHDDVSIQRGLLHWSYPGAPHVGTAVWMAQRDGRLEGDPLRLRHDLTSEARNRFAYLQATQWLRQLQIRLAGTAPPQPQRLNVAVLLIGPMLWSRYSVDGKDVAFATHVEGTTAGDLVIITEAPVIRALAQDRLSVHEAINLGVIRFYGDPAALQTAVQWIARSGKPSGLAKNAAYTK